MAESRKTTRLLLAVGITVAVVIVGLAVADTALRAKTIADAQAARTAAAAELNAAKDEMYALAENDGFAEYDAAMSAASAYSREAAYELTWMSGQVDAALLATFAQSASGLQTVIESSSLGEDIEAPPYVAVKDTTEAYAAATKRINTAIAAANSQISVTRAATTQVEAAIVKADKALLAVAGTIPADASTVAAAHPEADDYVLAMMEEAAGKVQKYLDDRPTSQSDSELVALVAQELLGTYYVTTPIVSYTIIREAIAG